MKIQDTRKKLTAESITPFLKNTLVDKGLDDLAKHIVDLMNYFNGEFYQALEFCINLFLEFKYSKLYRYGVTHIDFSKRQELKDQMLRLEGAINGLKLAQETFVLDKVKVKDPDKVYPQL